MTIPKREPTPCRYCGKSIVWARNVETNKRVPLSPPAPVYIAEGRDPDGTLRVKLAQKLLPIFDEKQAMLGHHYDCKEFHEQQKRGD